MKLEDSSWLMGSFLRKLIKISLDLKTCLSLALIVLASCSSDSQSVFGCTDMSSVLPFIVCVFVHSDSQLVEVLFSFCQHVCSAKVPTSYFHFYLSKKNKNFLLPLSAVTSCFT